MAGRPWQTLITLHETKREAFLRRVAMLEERLRHARDLQERIELYQRETGENFRQSVLSGPVSPTFLRGSTDFYARLDQGKAVQTAEIERLLQFIAEARADVLACDVEIMKYQKLIQRDQERAARLQAVAEQKQTDNLVNAAVARKLLIRNSRGK